MQRRQHRQVTVNGLCYDATAPRRIFDFTRVGIADVLMGRYRYFSPNLAQR